MRGYVGTKYRVLLTMLAWAESWDSQEITAEMVTMEAMNRMTELGLPDSVPIAV